MNAYAIDKRTISDAVRGGGLLIVAQWEAKDGEADKVAGILDRFLPEAQREEGAMMFLISRAKDNPAQFLFYELFRDEVAFKAHQESAHFKTYIAGQALPLLAKRERMQYSAAVRIDIGRGRNGPFPPKISASPETPACRHGHGRGRARRSGAASETPCRD
jgi:quinol monooxygenase YgiN